MEISTVRLLRPNVIQIEKGILDQDLNDDEILVETLVSAISPGTEISAYIGLPHLRQEVTYPRLLGYCNVGKILEVGKGVLNFQSDDLILTNAAHCSHYKLKSQEV